MIKYFRNNKTGALISFDEETKIVNEFEEISPNSSIPLYPGLLLKPETIGGGVDSNQSCSRKSKKDKKDIKKSKIGNRICSKCGKTVPPGKYLCKGMCSACYNLALYHKKHGNKAKSEKTASEHIKKYECIDCGAEIKSTLDIDQVKCPKNSAHKMVQK